jgi:glycosyltransferase involved in cell wall biosynthesis
LSDFKVSIVIPVFNASAYVAEAVESAVALPETGEILLIDDGSTDTSLDVCKKISERYSNVFLYQHPGGKNLGAAASRNLGIQKAKYDYVSFLDADDYYLPNRFSIDKEIFLAKPDADGVYGCNLAKFENEEARRKFLNRYPGEATTITERLSPEQLFKPLLFGGYGRFHTSAITLHKRSFQKVGLFNTAIRYVEDTELWLKLSLKTKLYPGSIERPVSIRRVHDTNSIHQIHKVDEYTKIMYQQLFDWALKQKFSFEVKNDFFIALHRFIYGNNYSVKYLFWNQVKRLPSLVMSNFFIKKIHQLYFIK